MLRSERNVIDKFAVDLKSDVLPIDLLPFLTCLTEDDREQIQFRQDREGPRSAVTILLDRLKKREKGFDQFLSALEENGCKHLQKKLSQALQSELGTNHLYLRCKDTILLNANNIFFSVT